MGKTPYEAWNNRKTNVSNLKIFGSIAYSLLASDARSKMDKKCEKCIFVGYSDETKGYRLYNPITKKLIIRRDIVFDENSCWIWDDTDMQHILVEDISSTMQQEIGASSSSKEHSPLCPEDDENAVRKVRSLRDIYDSCTFALLATEPSSYEEACGKKEWEMSMKEEIASIEKNDTWELVELPKEKDAIGVKWIYKVKYHPDGRVQKHKARLVAKGYVQKYGIDYFETYSPVARIETVRLLLAIAAQMKWQVFQFDVKSAFLNGPLVEDVYVEQPPGFVREGQEDKVYKLKKALYGLKQAPRAWYCRLDSYLQHHQFHRSESEPTLYVKMDGKDVLLVCVYVDDIIYTSSSISLIEDFKKKMMTEFDMTDLGLLHYFLGLQVKQSCDGIFVSQEKYALDLLKKFHMQKCKVFATPMNVNEKLSMDDGSAKADEKQFRSMVGSLMYLTHTRPDIMFAVGLVSRFMHNPSMHHLGTAKRILRYIRATTNYGIWYKPVANSNLIGFCDSDWAGFIDDRKSTSGFIFSLGSGAISWSSKKQASTALSSTETEYIAVASATCQAIWMRRILEDLHQKQEKPTEIFCDSKSAIAMTKNPVFHGRTKHLDLRHHFIRDAVAEGSIVIKYCSTHDQIADGLTKALNFEKFSRFRMQIGVADFASRGRDKNVDAKIIVAK